jgi:hypothetical protein
MNDVNAKANLSEREKAELNDKGAKYNEDSFVTNVKPGKDVEFV